jgi:hypothetical protein
VAVGACLPLLALALWVPLGRLERDDFLGAVTGHARAAEAAETVVADRMAAPAVPG